MQGAATWASVLVVFAGAAVCAAMPFGMGFGEESSGPKELAPYTVISERDTYEVREYEAAAWVCSERDGKPQNRREKMAMFMNLFRYMNGENSLGKELKLTAPLSTYQEKTKQGGMKKMQVCFYIPKEDQASPPTPTLEGVFINNRDKMRVAVRSFTGTKMSKGSWEAEQLMLQKDLKESGVQNVNFDKVYGAAYYSPQKEEHVNEIWYKMEE